MVFYNFNRVIYRKLLTLRIINKMLIKFANY